ncbi:MAG: hypothetical protein ACKVOK_16910 [Flavobacteriales bacterium]
MKKPLLLLILVFLTLFSFSQKKKTSAPTGPKVPVVIKWAKGETSYLKVSKSEENVASNEYYKIKTDYDVRLKVLEKTDTSYTMEWTYTTAKAVVEDYQLRGAIIRLADEEKIRGMIHQLLESTEESAVGMKVIYRTNEFGEFKEIINREEIRDQYKKTFRNMLGFLAAELPIEQRDSLNNMLNFMADVIVADPDFGLTFEDIQLVHTAYGYEYEPGVNQTMVGSMKSPFNDEEYEIDMDVKMAKYSSDKKNCTIEGKLHFGTEVMQEYISDFQETMRLQGFNTLDEIPEMEMNSDFALEIDLNYGWVYNATATTKTKENHDISTKILQITLRL